MAEILELVSSQPTLNRVHSFDAKIFSTISKRNSIVKIVSKRCLTNLCTPELLSNDQSASNRWKKKFMAKIYDPWQFGKMYNADHIALFIKNKKK